MIFFAPWLPPKTKTNGFSTSYPFSFFFSSTSCFVKSSLTTFVGLPVNTTFFAFGNLSLDSSNPTKILSAFLETHCVAFPGKTLLSCTKYGI